MYYVLVSKVSFMRLRGRGWGDWDLKEAIGFTYFQ